ncbi:sugar ABC transporter ATP-binding protein [Corynebacterium mendelii]|uniref:Sugar ABC transporter ATP-binding protein n=1 Tax=Corynebacterium mendelii TaxID=2765362 RepID=A0A939IUT7_9CORY|nr:sugar ABC transporter ATP-binding protein [Corynebacterium mendelii]MBN9645289.1 sugar ABC transporter ATP-binding protein [Corynebacterium mendelii]
MTTNEREGYKATGITKSYSNVPVLKGVDLTVRPGEIVGLIGHNGAGKSTLLKALSGAHSQDSGELSIDGTAVHFSGPGDAIEKGVATVYQELSLLTNLTVAENAFLGREIRGRFAMDRSAMRAKTQEMVERFNLPVDPDTPVGVYPVAVRQLLEIAIATTKNVRYLLLDEPTTSLEGKQVDRLLDYLKELAASGIGILIVDHKLDELYRLADRIVAIVDGQVCLDRRVDELNHDDVVEAIVGHGAEEQKGETESSAADDSHAVGLEVNHLAAPGCTDVSFTARKGEILGLYGLVGAGRTECLRAIAGIDPVNSGTILLEGVEVKPKNPAQMAKKGIVYVTEERKTDGIVPGMSGLDNVALPILDRFLSFGFLRRRKLYEECHRTLDSLAIRGDVTAPVVSLSGGNQQKVLLARAIAQNPTVLLLDEPTKGVDIGVKAQIHRILSDMAHEHGITLVIASSEEEEVLAASDRVVVFSQGKTISEPIPADQLDVAGLRAKAWQQGHQLSA